MTDLENRLSSENILGKVNRKNILDFFNDKKFELNSHGMDVVTHNLNIPKWNEYDKLSIQSIADMAKKMPADAEITDVPDPNNLLHALIYLRCASYLFINENGWEELVEGNEKLGITRNEIIPVLIEGLYVSGDYDNSLIKASGKTRVDFFYYGEHGYINELRKCCIANNDGAQLEAFERAYDVQKDLVTYYENHTKEFYKFLNQIKVAYDVLMEKIKIDPNYLQKHPGEEVPSLWALVSIAKQRNAMDQGKSKTIGKNVSLFRMFLNK